MQILHRNFWTALFIASSVMACAGNGAGIDAGTPGGTVTADFQSIQDNVFTPICSRCHIGLSAPQGLQLDAGHSYNMLVGVPSVEQPNLLRVNPGDPDASYMVHKVEGAAGITGGQMPLNEAPLPQATIDAIRQWVTDGASNAVAAAAAFAVQSTTPPDGTSVKVPPAQIVVAFTQEVDASLVNDTTVTLERIASSGDSGIKVSAASALARPNPAVLMITPEAMLGPGLYRVTLRGAGGGALANLNAATLGVDTSFEFTVEAGQ